MNKMDLTEFYPRRIRFGWLGRLIRRGVGECVTWPAPKNQLLGGYATSVGVGWVNTSDTRPQIAPMLQYTALDCGMLFHTIAFAPVSYWFRLCVFSSPIQNMMTFAVRCFTSIPACIHESLPSWVPIFCVLGLD